jgi:hypothetical protein
MSIIGLVLFFYILFVVFSEKKNIYRGHGTDLYLANLARISRGKKKNKNVLRK